MSSAILNVLDFGAKPDLASGASSDELEHNRKCIQQAIDELLGSGGGDGHMPDNRNLAALGLDSSEPVGATLRFPAGVYRICGRLNVHCGPGSPFSPNFAFLGDGGLGGTVIVQHKPDEPILEFTGVIKRGWAIGNLTFKWADPQSCDQDHSVAIHFFAEHPGSGFAHGVIERCRFEGAYRGISVTALEHKITVDSNLASQVVAELEQALGDENYVEDKPLPVLAAQFASPSTAMPFALPAAVTRYRRGRRWLVFDKEERPYFVWMEKGVLNVYLEIGLAVRSTHIEHCVFSGCKGSAVRLSSGTGNSISNTQITQIENNTPGRENEEPQLWFNAHTMVLTNLVMEGSSDMVMYADSSIITINGLSLGNLKPQATYATVLFLGDLSYDIHGLSLGGVDCERAYMVHLIQGAGGASITVSGVQAHLYDASKPIYLFAGKSPSRSGRKNAFRLVGRYFCTPRDSLRLCLPGMEDLVTVDPIKVRQDLTFKSIAPGTTALQPVAVTGARPGDVVSLGPPADLKAGLLAFGLATAVDTVEVRVLNATSASITPAFGPWTITTGGGRP